MQYWHRLQPHYALYKFIESLLQKEQTFLVGLDG